MVWSCHVWTDLVKSDEVCSGMVYSDQVSILWSAFSLEGGFRPPLGWGLGAAAPATRGLGAPQNEAGGLGNGRPPAVEVCLAHS